MENLLLQAVPIPVADVDRAKAFYVGLGWRLDADFPFDNGFRVVQLTPPGSPCSVQFGTDITAAAPGTAEGLYLIVSDIDAARRNSAAGAEVSEVFHPDSPGRAVPRRRRAAGRRAWCPTNASYSTFATFRYLDGNRLVDPGGHDPTAGTGGRAADLVRIGRRPGAGTAPRGGRPRGARGPGRRQVRRELAGLVRGVHGGRAGGDRAAHLRQNAL